MPLFPDSETIGEQGPAGPAGPSKYTSALDYAVDITGVNDSTAGIVAALESGEPIYFPKGTYTIAGTGPDSGGVIARISHSLHVDCHPEAVFVGDQLDNSMIRILAPVDGAGLPEAKIDVIWSGGIFDQRAQKNSTVCPYQSTYPPENPGTSAVCDGLSIDMSYEVDSVQYAAARTVRVSGVTFRAGDSWHTAGGDSALTVGAGADVVLVDSCTFYGSRDVAIYLTREEPDGTTGESAHIANCAFIGCVFGIKTSRNYASVLITRNLFHDAITGVITGSVPLGSRSIGVTVDSNTFMRCQEGVRPEYSTKTRITDNAFLSLGTATPTGTAETLRTPCAVYCAGALRTHIEGNDAIGVATAHAEADVDFLIFDSATVDSVTSKTLRTYVGRNYLSGLHGIASEAGGTHCDYSRYEANDATECTVQDPESLAPGSAIGATPLYLPGLPTTDPAQAGYLWNDNGSLKISAGA